MNMNTWIVPDASPYSFDILFLSSVCVVILTAGELLSLAEYFCHISPTSRTRTCATLNSSLAAPFLVEREWEVTLLTATSKARKSIKFIARYQAPHTAVRVRVTYRRSWSWLAATYYVTTRARLCHIPAHHVSAHFSSSLPTTACKIRKTIILYFTILLAYKL